MENLGLNKIIYFLIQRIDYHYYKVFYLKYKLRPNFSVTYS